MNRINRIPDAPPSGTRLTRWQGPRLQSRAILPALIAALAPASTVHALSIYKDNTLGNLSVVSPAATPDAIHAPNGWTDVPGLSSCVYARAGDNLEITVTAKIDSPGTVWLRALVDGVTSSPDDVAFTLGSPSADGVRSFTFVKKNASSGKNLIQVQWYSSVGTSARMGARSLSVNSAAPAWGTGRLAVAAAPSADWIVKTTNTWEAVPDLATTLTTAATSDIRITFSAESGVSAGRFFARPLIDGVAVSDVVFDTAEGWTHSGTRSYTFIKKGVPAGNHAITMQWLADGPGAAIYVADRTLTAFASPATATGGGHASSALESAPVPVTSTGWTDVPGMSRSFTTTDPSTTAQIAFSAEAKVAGQLHLRALVDGKAVEPGEVMLVANSAQYRALSFAFAAKNVLPGSHTVTLQARVGAAGSLGHLADRSLNVLFKRRHGLDFAQPYDSLKPRQGKVPMVVICFDPKRPTETRPTLEQVTNQHRGDDGQISVKGWYKENTGSRYLPDPITILGWYDAPTARQGNWYWDQQSWHLMWEDAIKAADAQFDFHQYDRNGDNCITGDELIVNVLRPQNGTDGYHRDTSVAVDGNPTPLHIDVLDVYFSANDANRALNVGLIAHEAAHGVLSAADMYSGYATNAGSYSLMSWHGDASHLDPFHKLKSGFLTPDVVEINKWSTKTIGLAAVETKREAVIIYDPAKKDREYFIIENRWAGSSSAPTYDSRLAKRGVVIWHIVEDMSLANQYPPTGAPGFEVGADEWGRKGVRFLQVLSFSGSSRTLKWADGTAAKIKVTAKGSPAETVNVEIAKLP